MLVFLGTEWLSRRQIDGSGSADRCLKLKRADLRLDQRRDAEGVDHPGQVVGEDRERDFGAGVFQAASSRNGSRRIGQRNLLISRRQHLSFQGLQARHLFLELAELLFEPLNPRRDGLARFLTVRPKSTVGRAG